ncbi:protein MGARP [Oenanthe melanoleuca]|uniref:protein MGARP n=1 Tax=Oenanthe melanoleuca TaxID=2939378 RepID=UPI0024C1A2F4|nr:protein MGARP [Oenanthe melanoleuca]
MSFCRAASQALASRLSRAPAAASRLQQRAPPRQMSTGNVPGSSRDSMMIYLLAGVAAFGGLFYAYRAVSSSRSKYIEHTNALRERDEEQKSNLWSRKEGDGEEVDEVPAAEKATEEADAAAAGEPAAPEESAGPTAQEESAGPTAQEESAGPPPGAGGEDDLQPPEVSPAVEEAQQEAAADSEAAADPEAAANSEAAANLELAANSEAAASF